MVHAMGPSGIEGPFRIACEKSLGLMRDQKDALMSALRPFYFDPLVDWVQGGGSKNKRGSGDETGEGVNAKAVETLSSIERRLKGLVHNKSRRKAKASGPNVDMPLSCVGQVDFLIREATSRDNLSQMYLGWSSFL